MIFKFQIFSQLAADWDSNFKFYRAWFYLNINLIRFGCWFFTHLKLYQASFYFTLLIYSSFRKFNCYPTWLLIYSNSQVSSDLVAKLFKFKKFKFFRHGFLWTLYFELSIFTDYNNVDLFQILKSNFCQTWLLICYIFRILSD